MKTKLRLAGASLAFVLMLDSAATPVFASGVGISTGGHDDGQAGVTAGSFWARRPGLVGSFKYRDLEFHWDKLYARDSAVLSAATRTHSTRWLLR